MDWERIGKSKGFFLPVRKGRNPFSLWESRLLKAGSEKMKSIKPNAVGKVETIFMSADMLKPDVEYNFKYTHTTNKTSKAGKEIEWHIFLGTWDNKMTEIMIPDFIMISEVQDFKFKPDKDYKLSKYTEKDILIGSD